MSFEVTEEKPLEVESIKPTHCKLCGLDLEGRRPRGDGVCRICSSTSMHYVPTPEQIAETCREIQSTWTWEMEYSRRVVKGYERDLAKLFAGTSQEPDGDETE